jgi:ADP-ribose pyrophosphatase
VTESAEQDIYSGRVVTLRLRRLTQPDGRVLLREVVEHAPGAAVVAIDSEGLILLVRQNRPAVGAAVLELPAGLVDPGESPEECAARELAEETDFAAGRLEPLLRFYSSPGFCTELLHIFVATDLRAAPSLRDEEEDMEVVRLPLDKSIEQVLHGEISDAKTVAGLLAYWRTTARTT